MSTIALKLKSSVKLPLLDQAVVSGNNFLQGVILARALGADIFGAWAAGQLGLLLFLSLNQAFVTTPMLTFLGKKEPNDHKVYLQTLAMLQVFVAVLGSIVGFVASIYLFKTENIHPIQFGSAVFFFLLWDFSRRQLLSIGKVQVALILDFLLFLVQTGGFLLLYLTKNLSLSAAWLLWTGSLAVVNLICYGAFLKFNKKIDFAPISIVSAAHWQDGRWLLLTALLQWFAGNYFIASSAVWIGQAALGTARMAQNIVGVLNIVLISLENTWPVTAAKTFKEKGIEGMFGNLQQGMRRSAPFVLAFLGIFGLLGTVLFQLLFGNVPEGTSLVIWGYVGVYVLTFVALPLRIALRTLGLSKIIFISYLVSAVFSLLMAPVFLKYWQLSGMVTGMVFCQILQLVVCIWGIKKQVQN
jgi:O-antigen/teichoic acid export membrane protein